MSADEWLEEQHRWHGNNNVVCIWTCSRSRMVASVRLGDDPGLVGAACLVIGLDPWYSFADIP